MLIPAARAFCCSSETVVARRTLPAVVEMVMVRSFPPLVQNPPAAWAGLSYADMVTAMNNYVFHAMHVINSAGVTPAWVQIGNLGQYADWQIALSLEPTVVPSIPRAGEARPASASREAGR